MSPSPAQATKVPVVIDIVSDVVCPWCYVGKRRLETALRERPAEEVTVCWHPFQLDPTIPPEGLDRASYMVRKFGSPQTVDAIHERLIAAGQEEGLTFAFGSIKRSVNTLDAHRLLRWSGDAGVQNAVKEALFRAYFTEGRNIGEAAVLADIAGEQGLPAAEIAARLAGDADREAVRDEIATAARMGVSGVPYFIFAGSFAVSGAQSPAVLAAAIDRAREHLANPGAAILSA